MRLLDREPSRQDQHDENFLLGDYLKICRDSMLAEYVVDLELRFHRMPLELE
jgi:hypothetical protein